MDTLKLQDTASLLQVLIAHLSIVHCSTPSAAPAPVALAVAVAILKGSCHIVHEQLATATSPLHRTFQINLTTALQRSASLEQYNETWPCQQVKWSLNALLYTFLSYVTGFNGTSARQVLSPETFKLLSHISQSQTLLQPLVIQDVASIPHPSFTPQSKAAAFLPSSHHNPRQHHPYRFPCSSLSAFSAVQSANRAEQLCTMKVMQSE